MKSLKAMAALAAFSSVTAFAAVGAVSEQEFISSLPPEGSLSYSETIATFQEWRAAQPKESEVLVLFPGYTEPEVTFVRNGETKSRTELVQMYVARTKMVVNKPSGQLNLAPMIDLNNLSQLDPAIKHVAISQADILPNVLGKKEVTNFAWCTDASIVRPSKEVSMQHLAGTNFCQPGPQSICIESCYPYPSAVGSLMSLAGAVDSKDPKDTGTGSQSEIRYYLNEKEFSPNIPLAEITGVQTPVVGVVVQNMFYFNQILQYAKLVAVLQAHPTDNSKTVMTAFLAIGIKQHSWNKYHLSYPMRKGLPTSSTGMLAGIPTYSQLMTQAIGKILEQ